MKTATISSCVINLSLLNYGIVRDFITTLPNDNDYNLPYLEHFLPTICIVCGFICGAIVTDYFGRKVCIILANIPLVISWLLLYFCTNHVQKNIAYGLLYFNSCLISLPVVVFISEITKSNVRSRLLASSFFFISLGAIIEETFKFFFNTRQTMLMNCIVPCVLFVVSFFIRESPYWLIEKERIEKARINLNWYLSNENGNFTIENEFKCLCKEMGKLMDLWIDNSECVTEEKPIRSLISRLASRQFVNTLWTINFISFAYHFCGLALPKYYLANFLASHSLKNNIIFVITYESLQMCGTFISVFNQHYLGRRLLNMTTISLLGIINLLLAICCFANNINSLVSENVTSPWNIVAFILMISVIIVVNCGLRSLPWILCGELFENRVKCYGVALVGIFSYVFEKIFKIFLDNRMIETNLFGSCLLFTFVSFICVIFIRANLIETEGKTLFNIQKLLRPIRLDKRIDNQMRSFNINEMNNYCHI